MNISIVLILLIGGFSAAVAADHIGVFLDITADTVCDDVPEELSNGFSFEMWVAILEPSSPEIWGVEYRLCTVFPGLVGLFLEESFFAGLVEDPGNTAYCGAGRNVRFTAPIIPVDGVALIAYYKMGSFSSDAEIDTYLSQPDVFTIDDGLPAYIGVGEQAIPLNVTSGNTGLPVLSINGCRTVGSRQISFDALKTLYR